MRKVRCMNRFADCQKRTDELNVQPGLAVTPAQMMRMTEQGVAVSSQIAGDFFDGEVNPDWSVPLDRVRGIDIVDVWQAEQVARKNIVSHHKANVAQYGDSTIKKIEGASLN